MTGRAAETIQFQGGSIGLTAGRDNITWELNIPHYDWRSYHNLIGQLEGHIAGLPWQL